MEMPMNQVQAFLSNEETPRPGRAHRRRFLAVGLLRHGSTNSFEPSAKLSLHGSHGISVDALNWGQRCQPSMVMERIRLKMTSAEPAGVKLLHWSCPISKRILFAAHTRRLVQTTPTKSVEPTQI